MHVCAIEGIISKTCIFFKGLVGVAPCKGPDYRHHDFHPNLQKLGPNLIMIIIKLTLMMMLWICFHSLSSVTMILTLKVDLKPHVLCHKSWQCNFSKMRNSASQCSALQSPQSTPVQGTGFWWSGKWRLVSVLVDQREIHFSKIYNSPVRCRLVQCSTVNYNVYIL